MILGNNIGTFAADGQLYEPVGIIQHGLAYEFDASYLNFCQSTLWFDKRTMAQASMVNTTPSPERGSYLFNGTNSYGDLGSLKQIGSSWTISAWVNGTNWASPSIQNITGNDGAMYLVVRSSKIQWFTGADWREINRTLVNNKWYYLTYRLENISGTPYHSLFLDGVLGYRGSDSLGPETVRYIGNHNITSETRWLNALLGRLEIYTRALSDDEIARNYNVNRSKYEKY